MISLSTLPWTIQSKSHFLQIFNEYFLSRNCSFELRYILFDKQSSQGNHWHEELIYIEPVDQPFQIVFEASGMRSVVSDIAIDDVALLNDTTCMKFFTTERTTEEIGGGIFDMQTCVNRCNETQSVRLNGSYTEVDQDGFLEKCDCHKECVDLGTCCFDFRNTCLDGK